MILHGVSGSPFVRKVQVALAMKGLPYEQIQQIPFTKDPEYRKINPLGKIPTLQDGDLILCDSTVICEYLEETYPQMPLYPATSADRAKARWFEELGGSRVTELAAGIFSSDLCARWCSSKNRMRTWLLKSSTSSCLLSSITWRPRCLHKAIFSVHS